jgi:hypothetical protein
MPPSAREIEVELQALGYSFPTTSNCLSLCCSLCNALQITKATSFVNQLHAFVLRNGIEDFVLSEKLLNAFQASFDQKKSPLKSSKSPVIYTKDSILQLEDELLELYCTKETQAKIKAQREALFLNPFSASSCFKGRQDAGNVELIFPTNATFTEGDSNESVSCSLISARSLGKKRFSNSVRTVFDALNQRIEAFEEKLLSELRLVLQEPSLNFSHPLQSCTEAFWTAGMILMEQAEVEGKRIHLQTSKQTGTNCKVHLRLEALEEGFFLFPGQIVAVYGKNLDENTLFVQKIISGLNEMPGSGIKVETSEQTPNENTVDSIEKTEDSNGNVIYPMQIGQPSNESSTLEADNSPTALVNVACGPFCLEGSLDWEPLEAFLEVCKKQKVKFIILCGPFIPESLSSALNGFPEVILREQIFERFIFDFCQEFPEVQVFVVPSCKEISSLISPSSLPQPAMKVNKQQNLDNLNFCTNPFAIDFFADSDTSVKLRLLNADVLLGLSREEVTKANKNCPSPMFDRMSRLAGYLVKQQNLFPLVSADFPVEYAQFCDDEAFACGRAKREILVLPSSLRFFAKRIASGSVTVVNPGQLCRSQAGGVYTQIRIGQSDVAVKVIKI